MQNSVENCALEKSRHVGAPHWRAPPDTFENSCKCAGTKFFIFQYDYVVVTNLPLVVTKMYFRAFIFCSKTLFIFSCLSIIETISRYVTIL
jgi:hypothetical protein